MTTISIYCGCMQKQYLHLGEELMYINKRKNTKVFITSKWKKKMNDSHFCSIHGMPQNVF